MGQFIFIIMVDMCYAKVEWREEDGFSRGKSGQEMQWCDKRAEDDFLCDGALSMKVSGKMG